MMRVVNTSGDTGQSTGHGRISMGRLSPLLMVLLVMRLLVVYMVMGLVVVVMLLVGVMVLTAVVPGSVLSRHLGLTTMSERNSST